VALQQLAMSDVWVAEGVHLAGMDALFTRAETIVWLDTVGWMGSSQRVVSRFVRQAIDEAKRQKGLRRFVRFRDYGRQLYYLIRAIPEARAYHRAQDAAPDVPTRAATLAKLEEHASKVVRCRTQADVDSIVERLAQPG
jgi:hypothetical protein